MNKPVFYRADLWKLAEERMKPWQEIEWLQRVIGSCSRSADAYKTGYMLADDPAVERRLFERCRQRYETLERLLNALLAHGVAPQRVRAALEDGAGSTCRRTLRHALDEAETADQEIALLLGRALGRGGGLRPELEAFLRRQYLASGFQDGGPVVAAEAAEMPVCRRTPAGVALGTVAA